MDCQPIVIDEEHFLHQRTVCDRRFDLHEYAPFPAHVHLAFKLIPSDQTTHFYSVDNVTVCLLTDGIDAQNDNQSAVFNVYPNPTTGSLNVQCSMNDEQLGDGEIQVLNVYGRVLDVVGISDARSASLQSTQINLSRYATGLCLVRLVNGGEVMAVRKVVKE